MRVALFSDVHGNAVPFDAFLADLDRQDVDQVVCLGDHAQGGPQPAECLERLRDLECPAVMGNSDDFLLTLDPGDEPVTEAQLETARWSQAQLSKEQLDFHRSFQPTVELDLGGGRSLLAFHGTPRSRNEIVGPWMDEEAFREPFADVDATVLAGGHTHQQWARRLGDRYYVNPGSVGLAYDHHQTGRELPRRHVRGVCGAHRRRPGSRRRIPAGPLRRRRRDRGDRGQRDAAPRPGCPLLALARNADVAEAEARYILAGHGIRPPLEEALFEAGIELGPHHPVAVQACVLLLPLGRHRLKPVPCELVDDQRATQQTDKLVERDAEVVEVVERHARDNRVEGLRLGEGLDRRPPEDVAVGRLGIDRDDVVAGSRQRIRERALAATDLEYAARRGRKLREYEVDELRHRGRGYA